MNGSFYVIALAVAALVLWRRTRSMRRPIKGNGARLLIPLIFMLPAMALIMNPEIHAEAWEWGAAIVLGILLSIPLIWTTHYEVREDGYIYARKNMGFVFAFIGVIAIRFLLRAELSSLDQQTLSALFLTVAIGYLIPWRIVSFIRFRRLVAAQQIRSE